MGQAAVPLQVLPGLCNLQPNHLHPAHRRAPAHLARARRPPVLLAHLQRLLRRPHVRRRHLFPHLRRRGVFQGAGRVHGAHRAEDHQLEAVARQEAEEEERGSARGGGRPGKKDSS